jgi:hypothetical protein
MNNNTEINYIQECCYLVEAQFNRGGSDEWTSYDFEKLSEAIREKTGVILSVTTLKRLWGKLQYNNTPTTTTLNTLAQFAGFDDWRSFKSQFTPGLTAVPIVPYTSKPHPKWSYWLSGLVLLLLIPLLYLGFLSGSQSRIPVNPAAYTFSSKTVTTGVPNSVIFHYDATAAGTDTVFIAQSWDISRKIAVPKDKKEFSAIYYHPGYFRAKLIVGKQIVKEHDLMISSGGWMALIEKEDVPLYFRREEFLKKNMIAVDKATLSAYNIPLQPHPPALRFYNVLDMEGLQTDNFTFETSVKSDFNQGIAACQRVEILLLCKQDVISIPLCAKGCVGDLQLYAAGKAVQSSEADLSKFGCNPGEWVHLRIETRNKQMRFLVNGEEAYALSFPNPPATIVGVQYRFNGTGAVKETRFIKGNEVIDL